MKLQYLVMIEIARRGNRVNFDLVFILFKPVRKLENRINIIASEMLRILGAMWTHVFFYINEDFVYLQMLLRKVSEFKVFLWSVFYCAWTKCGGSEKISLF